MDEVLRWLNQADAKTRKRRQAQLARFEAMDFAQKIKSTLRNLRYVRTSYETVESVLNSAVNASTPGTPEWQEVVSKRDYARTMKESVAEAIANMERLQPMVHWQVIGPEGTDGQEEEDEH